VITASTGTGTRANPVTAQTCTNTQPLDVWENVG
jgi:hypothetical protein